MKSAEEIASEIIKTIVSIQVDALKSAAIEAERQILILA